MNFFKIFIIVFIIALFSSSSQAEGLSYQEKSELREAGYSYSDIRKIEEEREYKYKGTSGTKYKYDLSKPEDKLKYELDVGAQINDKIYMPIKPGVKLDRGLNQYGGGMKE